LPAPSATAPEIPLEPYDNVLILRQPDWELQSTVVVRGEVKFPGVYTLTSKTERLSDVLQRAGGLTAEAYADGIVFYRNERHLGRVGISLPDVLRNADSRDNLVLVQGDSIYVPPYSPVVRVEGAVNSPVGVAFVPGQGLDYYLRAAGGPSRNADEGRAYVRQPNGQVEAVKKRTMWPDGKPTPRAGAVVYVPERDPNDRKDYAAIAGAVAQILTSTVAILAIISKI
jgi:protein involved in polysaccharide export with SLBB domain